MTRDTYWARRLTRRGMLAGTATGVAGVAAAAMGACGDDDDDKDEKTPAAGQASPQTSAQASPAAQAPRQGGRLRSGIRLTGGGIIGPVATRPQYLNNSLSYGVVSQLIQNNPTKEAELIPDLAERWEQASPTEWIFKLRPGVTWHNADPLTADEVLFSVERAKDPIVGASAAPEGLAALAKAEAVDKATVKFTLSRPSAVFVANFASIFMVIHNPKATVNEPIGTGPYMVTAHEPNVRLRLAKNPKYFVQGKPYLDQVELIGFADDTGETNACRAGELEMTNDTRAGTTTDYSLFQGLGWKVSKYVGSRWAINFINKAPFTDERVRRAFNLAMDRRRIQDVAFQGGGGVLGGQNIPKESVGQWGLTKDEVAKLPGYGADRDKDLRDAKQLLEAARGAGVNLSGLKVSTWNLYQRETEVFLQLIKQDLGVDFGLNSLERAPWTQALGTGNFDLNFSGLFVPVDDPSLWLQTFNHSKGSRNWPRLNDPQIDADLEKQDTMLNRQERATFVHDLELKLMNMNWWSVASWRTYFTAYSPKVQGYSDMSHIYSNHNRWADRWVTG